MIRDINGSTMLTYHPAVEWKATTAANLHTRVYLAGQSVYWQKIFYRSSDPTFMFLATLWYSLYAWDEAFETLWDYICLLVSAAQTSLYERSRLKFRTGIESYTHE